MVEVAICSTTSSSVWPSLLASSLLEPKPSSSPHPSFLDRSPPPPLSLSISLDQSASSSTLRTVSLPWSITFILSCFSGCFSEGSVELQ